MNHLIKGYILIKDRVMEMLRDRILVGKYKVEHP